MKIYFTEASEPITTRGKIDWNKVQKICNFIFESNEDNVRSWVDFSYKSDGLLCSTCYTDWVHEYDEDTKITKDIAFENRFKQKCKENGYQNRIYLAQHKERFDVISGIVISFKIPYSEVFKDKYL